MQWIGNKAKHPENFFNAGKIKGTSDLFDTIILATGFGIEIYSETYPTDPYWRNEQRGQPVLDGTRHTYVVSGFGDGALIDD